MGSPLYIDNKSNELEQHEMTLTKKSLC